MAYSSSTISGRTALVFGATGVTGWAVLREALRYPSGSAFDQIIGASNRPVDISQLYLPKTHRLSFASGIDLTKSFDEVVAVLRTVEGISNVTDVYFAAYIQPTGTSDFEGFELLKQINVQILETAVRAVESVSPKLQFWSLQTGGKSYGFVHARQIGLPKTPCQESDPRIPQPFEDQVFYYAQYDALVRLSAGKPWRFAEIRPDLVIGFVPGGKNAMNFAQALGIFLSFYADREPEIDGKKTIPFPGTPESYTARHTEIGQRTLGRAHIFSSTIIDSQNGEIFNIGDSPLSSGLSWKDKWAAVCGYFSLEGTGPEKGASRLSVTEYMALHKGEVDGFEKKHGLRPGIVQGSSWEFLEVLLALAAFDRYYDLAKFDRAGFHERSDVIQNYVEAFELMKKARIIP
ncbi:hypothetical protein GQ53DRAFT_793696 [Thozetella sp. PMI_491]|nr:hypothetical protein GQ53DRAFT_793696 [Thozetella sp. PMI_491]